MHEVLDVEPRRLLGGLVSDPFETREIGRQSTDTSHYILKEARPAFTFTFFISSSAQMLSQRDWFQEATRIANEQFRTRWRPPLPLINLDVDRWEQDAGHKSQTDLNADFVRRAQESHLTVVLLGNQLRPGTQEEIEGVLAVDNVQLAVLWMRDIDRRTSGGLRQFLRSNRDNFLWNETGPPGSRQATLSMLKILFSAVADVTNIDRREELFVEQR